jgi:Ca2+-binding RTX toxin-like protein
MQHVKRLTVPATLAVLLVVGAVVSAPPEAEAAVACWGYVLTLPVGTLIGTPGDDVMLGTPGDDVMSGLGGDDVICGGGGNDRIYGGPGFDRIQGGGGNDLILGQQGCDWIQGGDGNDVIMPGAGGVACAGTAEGGPGRDRFVIVQEGDNDVFGGTGRDTIDFRHAPVPMSIDLSTGHYDSMTVVVPIGSLVFEVENAYGSPFGDTIVGSAQVNRLLGFGGDDTIFGRGGDDLLDGGAGTDTLNGGAGTDSCLGGEIFSSCELP